MITQRGIAEKVGNRSPDTGMSPAMAEFVHQETQRFIQEAYERSKKVLLEHRSELQALAEALMKHETLDDDAIRIVIARAVVLRGHF